MGFADLVARVDRSVQDRLGKEPVTYTPAFGTPVTTTPSGAPLMGIFDDPDLLATGNTVAGTGVESVEPTVALILADLPTDPLVDDPLLTIRGKVYKVSQRRTAGFGSIVLALQLAG